MLAFFMSAKPLAAEVAVPLIPGIPRPKSAGRPLVGAPTIEKETRAEEALDLPWHVVVHNDPVNLMSYVTMVFQRVFGYPRDKAERHMLEVHQKRTFDFMERHAGTSRTLCATTARLPSTRHN
jgi:Uncharacterized conserved protein